MVVVIKGAMFVDGVVVLLYETTGICYHRAVVVVARLVEMMVVEEG